MTKPRKSWFTALLVVAAIAVWAYNESQIPARGDRRSSPGGETVPGPSDQGRIGGYEVYRNCTLAEGRNNDGDSFRVNLQNGKIAEFRLYFVDTPESAFKSYAGGDTNHERIRQQAAEMGGITPEQAVEIGKHGKQFTLDLLARRPFDLYTRWDSPFNDDRFHAFVKVEEGGKSRWLAELLVENGLARIKTKPADLPDGTTASKQLGRLKELERGAKRAEVGAWGMP